jgi:hypothetical protein
MIHLIIIGTKTFVASSIPSYSPTLPTYTINYKRLKNPTTKFQPAIGIPDVCYLFYYQQYRYFGAYYVNSNSTSFKIIVQA